MTTAPLSNIVTPNLTPRAAREQRTFRTLIDAMARPGTIASIEPLPSAGRLAAAATLLEALVDHEVTFAFVPGEPSSEEAVLRQTGSRKAPVAAADYVVAEGPGVGVALAEAKEGAPEYPDRSATVIVIVESISGLGGPGEAMVLSGPGIRDRVHLMVDGFGAELKAALNERNSQLPLGLDLVLITPNGRFACLPRYTRINHLEHFNDVAGIADPEEGA